MPSSLAESERPMVGASKILTVSYGTFSCTLEGFEEPFSTMKAIAEYFRDLAADDRYFGAEPATPDAEMLHRIAEREINRRVEAKINEHGVILRAQELPAPAGAAPPVMPPVMPAEPVAAPVVAAQAEAAPILPYEADPVAAADAEPGVEDSVAAKLQRLRASVAQAQAGVQAGAEHPQGKVYTGDLYAEDSDAETDPPVTGTIDAAFDDAFGLDTGAEGLADGLLGEPLIDFSDAEPVATASEALSAADDYAEDADDSVAAMLDRIEANVAQAQDAVWAEAEAAAGPLPVWGADDVTGALVFEVMPAPDELDAVLAPQEELETGAETVVTALPRTRARVIRIRREAILAARIQAADAAALALDALVLPADAFVEELDGEPDDPVLMRIGASIGHTSLSAEDEADLFAELAEVEREAETDQDFDEIAPDAGNGVDAAVGNLFRDAAVAEDVAMAGGNPVAEDSAVADTAEAEDQSGRVDAALLHSLNADAAPELLAETTAEGGELSEPAATPLESKVSDGRAILENVAEPREDAISRLFEQTANELDDPESRRRLQAISHLKAAVAATEAEKEMKPAAGHADTMPTDLDRYRDDLAKVVRPRRPEAGTIVDRRMPLPVGEQRPAPLVLVSEQRIDRPAPGPDAMMIRPRRVMTSVRAMERDEEEDFDSDEADILEDSKSFAEFAERIGAHGLSDLLEAAAAFAAYVEGRPSFSRPQIMKKIASFNIEDPFSREDGLRSFGMLLRQGKIHKVKRGQFAIAKTSRFIPEARRMAQ